MGRRARTNCSPVDSAMEKYHNDIGNRLSGVFLPTHPCPTNNDDSNPPCDAFSMLTLDFRGAKSCKATTSATKPQLNNQIINNSKSNTTYEESSTDYSLNKDDSAFDNQTTSYKHTDTLSSSSNSRLNNSSSSSSLSIKEKRNIMDKLARAIFQRKHTCTRCQRKSKSCLQNKTTFNLGEKHYTCARCRETSRAIKNLVSGQDTLGLHNTSDVTKINSDIIVPNKPRVEVKDSGYETVTSCSTVASAHSNSPYASSNKQTHENNSSCRSTETMVAPQCTRQGDHQYGTSSDVIRKVNNAESASSRLAAGCPVSNCKGHALHYTSKNTTTPNSNTNTDAHDNSSHANGLDQFLGVVGDGGVRVLKQVKNRFVHDYDGYLPDHDNTVVHSHNNYDVLALSGHHHHNKSNLHNQQQKIDTNNNNIRVTTKPADKSCHICGTSSRPCFRLPWEGGWLCEDCIDGML